MPTQMPVIRQCYVFFSNAST